MLYQRLVGLLGFIGGILSMFAVLGALAWCMMHAAYGQRLGLTSGETWQGIGLIILMGAGIWCVGETMSRLSQRLEDRR